MDIDGGADVDPPGRDPIVGPPGVLLGVVLLGVVCTVGGGVVGLGAEVGCGLPVVGPGFVVVCDVEGCASLIDPACRSEPEGGGMPGPSGAASDDDCDSDDPPGKPPPLAAPAEESAALFSSAGGRPAELPQAAQKAQTRAAATAVAAALASATVPRLGMDATVANANKHAPGDSSVCTLCAARLLHRIRPARLFA